jgi:hypothetical protein
MEFGLCTFQLCLCACQLSLRGLEVVTSRTELPVYLGEHGVKLIFCEGGSLGSRRGPIGVSLLHFDKVRDLNMIWFPALRRARNTATGNRSSTVGRKISQKSGVRTWMNTSDFRGVFW